MRLLQRVKLIEDLLLSANCKSLRSEAAENIHRVNSVKIRINNLRFLFACASREHLLVVQC